ncbi:peptidoglycan-binding domain-containing protein [Streptomyces albicerus]|uniref:peptidoglycan-binding domain-containing protein n=1 Tax=Streptomyces albicerus TaxID=2569859 RepID=UPI001788CABB|nr:peptidoglycan-binding protein [Streptomyces albicerus]
MSEQAAPGTPPTTDTPEPLADPFLTVQLPRAIPLPHSPNAGTHLFEAQSLDPLPGIPEDAEDLGGTTSRRRRFAMVGAGATAVVVAAAGFASGLFSYETPSRDTAAPDDIRASVPDATTDEPSPSKSESPTQSPSTSPSASSSPSTPPPTSEPAAPPTPSSTATTTRPPTTGRPTDSAPPTTNPPGRTGPVVLRPGDEGPEVTELQQRLQQLALYAGTPNGDYDNRTENAVRSYQVTRGINNEEPGVYGEETRQRLETETAEPQGTGSRPTGADGSTAARPGHNGVALQDS